MQTVISRRISNLLCLSTALILSAPHLAQADTLFPDVAAGKIAAKSGDTALALANWEQLAERGNTDAQLELGILYLKGENVPQDHAKAFDLLSRATKSGSPRAYLELGSMYEDGKGTPKNLSKAEELYSKAAALGYPRAHYYLGRLYDRNASLSPQTAQIQYMKAAENYRKALTAGYFGAARNLGILHEKGLGATKDPVTAMGYYYLGITSKSTSAQLSADKLSPSLTTEQDNLAKVQANAMFLQYQTPPAPADKNYRIIGDFKTQVIAEDNVDLGTRSDEQETSIFGDAKLGLYYYPTESITTYVEARAITSSGMVAASNDETDDSADATYGELRQAWVEIDDIGGDPRLSVKAGRQRFYEPRAIWWNRDFDAVRFNLDSTLTKGFIAAGQNLDNYRIGDDDEFPEDDKDRARVLGEISHEIVPNHRLEGRFLYENDYSESENVGSLIDANDRDDEDSQLLWTGVRSAGHFDYADGGTLQRLGYRADGIIVAGEETRITSTAGPGGNVRTATGDVDRDVFGWAFDGGVDATLNAPLSPTFTLGYAYGSGDDDTTGTGTNNAFRQTDLQGNTSRYPSDTSLNTSRNYGEVLRPELSNLHIVQTGVNVPMLSASDIGLTYFAYWMDEEATSLRSSGISAALNGQDHFVGQALDLGINIDWDEELNLTAPLLNASSSRVRLGTFKAGEAYGAAEDEYAYRGTLEFRIRF